MATYTYETIPQKPGEEPLRFEVQQSMMDDALQVHPDTGVPVKRVITGGLGIMGIAKAADHPPPRPAATNTAPAAATGEESDPHPRSGVA